MSMQLSTEIAVCSELQRLLEESNRALEFWSEHRARFCRVGSVEREAGDELLRLQAKYARAYAALQNHERNCLLCQLVSHTEGRDVDLFDYEMCT